MNAKEATIIKLAQCLKNAGVDRDTALNVSLRLRSQGNAEQMIARMEKNTGVAVDDICRISRKISRGGVGNCGGGIKRINTCKEDS